jgi:phosphonate transport system substrate-binding protein
MLRPSRLILAAVALIATTCAAWAEERPLRVILLPFTNTLSLMEMYQPLREHLQTALGRPVHLFGAADFTNHFQDVRRRDYDLAITGPHFGAWAVAHGAVPVLRYKPMLKPVLVVRAADGVTRPEQLKGKIVALSNRLSVSSITGESWLAKQGMLAGRDYKLVVSPTHTTAIMAVAMGEADAAITTHTPVQQAPDDVKAAIREIESPEAVPHLFTIANPALPPTQVAAIKSAILSFAETEAGKAFLAKSGYQGYVEISQSDLDLLKTPVALLADIVPEAAQ